MSLSSSSVTNGPTTFLPRVAARRRELLISVRPPTSGRRSLVSAATGRARISARRSLKRSASDFGAISQNTSTNAERMAVPAASGKLW